MTELICICCPRGCELHVDEENNYRVSGNSCPRGAAYGYSELTSPMRSVSAAVAIDSRLCRRCPVKTSAPVPKEKVFAVMEAAAGLRLHVPVKRGDTVIKNVAATGADMIVCRDFSF